MPIIDDEQKSKIVKMLGYPYDYYNFFTVLTLDLPVDLLSDIDFLMSEIDRVDSSIISGFQTLSIKKVDEIEFFASKDTDIVTSFYDDRKRFISRLSQILDIPLAYGFVHQVTYQ